jgi:hypothetical protein
VTKFRKIVPKVPRDEAERGELLEDLQVMHCSRFLEKPWGFKDDWIVRELLDGVSNEFDNSIRGQPIRWTEECWRECGNTDSNFFALRPQISTKTGSLRFGNK